MSISPLFYLLLFYTCIKTSPPNLQENTFFMFDVLPLSEPCTCTFTLPRFLFTFRVDEAT